MTGLLIMGILLICAAVLFVLASPFRRAPGEPAGPEAGVPVRPAARDEKERLLQGIADLRFDYEAGKISAADFDDENARLRARAAALLEELEGGPSTAERVTRRVGSAPTSASAVPAPEGRSSPG
ncbi:MAG: hypothetical protein H0V09_02500 [Gemmatimonadetes bacterium]|nr:hypothetical protein [Gemmatimonadota bacterium]